MMQTMHSFYELPLYLQISYSYASEAFSKMPTYFSFFPLDPLGVQKYRGGLALAKI
jgi:hypothetical protein